MRCEKKYETLPVSREIQLQRLKRGGFLRVWLLRSCTPALRSSVSGIQTEGSHLPQNRDNNSISIYVCSFPVHFSCLTMRQPSPPEIRCADDFARDLIALRIVSCTSLRSSISSTNQLTMHHHEIIQSKETLRESRKNNLWYWPRNE